MTSRRQDFRLFVRFLAIAAIAAALPAWAAPAWAQTATPTPDFSGIWAHPSDASDAPQHEAT